jgi:hypothetical protein
VLDVRPLSVAFRLAVDVHDVSHVLLFDVSTQYS